MSKWAWALLSAALVSSPVWADGAAGTNGGSILDQTINNPGVGNWNIWKALATPRKDDTVPGERSIRITATKGEHPWDAGASVAFLKPVHQGDILLVAFWARTEVPPPGRKTALLNSVGVQMVKAPYSGLFGEPIEIGTTWKMYYASGVMDHDYRPGEINLSAQLAAADQTIDLGPMFVIDMGPNYDRSKLPHNQTAAAAPTAPTAAAASATVSPFAAALNKIQAQLPVKGVLLSDPSQAPFVYGSDQTNQPIDAPEVPGGKAVRATMAQKAAAPWSDGFSAPLHGAIHKGDTLVMTVYARVADAPEGTGVISPLAVTINHAPWTRLIERDVMPKAGAWHTYTVTGVSVVDAGESECGTLLLIGGAKQTVDIGPIFVLNLGPGVDPAKVKLADK